MPEFRYAKGRIMESLSYITREMNEFDSDYMSKTWADYSSDGKLQKLIDRTMENILTAIIEVSGVILTEMDIVTESYVDVMKKIGDYFKFTNGEKENLAKLAVQRNRLAHRYLNFRWQVVKFYTQNRELLKKLVNSIYEYERSKQEEGQ